MLSSAIVFLSVIRDAAAHAALSMSVHQGLPNSHKHEDHEDPAKTHHSNNIPKQQYSLNPPHCIGTRRFVHSRCQRQADAGWWYAVPRLRNIETHQGRLQHFFFIAVIASCGTCMDMRESMGIHWHVSNPWEGTTCGGDLV